MKGLEQHWVNVSWLLGLYRNLIPANTRRWPTMGQRQPNIGTTSRVSWIYIGTCATSKHSYLSKHETSAQCCADVGPVVSATQGRIQFFSEGEGLNLTKKKRYFTVQGSRGTPPGKCLISKGFFMQSKAYWALFLTQYITKS